MAFIVFEGLDGAGKSTQVQQLQQLLKEQGVAYEYLHFPRFDTPVYGELIARFLRGELGAVDQVNPYLVALIYAGDRKAAAGQIRNWVEAGKFVIVDRYVSSNIAYQCAKFEDDGEKEELRRWILDLEYSLNGIPQPDVTLFLDVPFAFTEHSLAQHRQGDDRNYLRGKADIHEASLTLQQAVREVYLNEARQDPSMHVVTCSGGEGEMLPAQSIFEKIRSHIHHLLPHKD